MQAGSGEPDAAGCTGHGQQSLLTSLCRTPALACTACWQPGSTAPLNAALSRSLKCSPVWHQLAARMAPLTGELDPQGCRGSNGRHHPQLQALLLQQGPLLDVQLHKRADGALLCARALEDVLHLAPAVARV